MCNLLVILLLLNLQVLTLQAACDRTDRSFTTFRSNTNTNTNTTQQDDPHNSSFSMNNVGQFDLHLHQKQEQNLLDELRLEYFKYKIVSHLDISTNPDDINPNLNEELKNSIRLARNNSSQQILNAPMINSRQKRSLSCSEVKSDKNACCLETFFVNFTDIGWDKWIIYPHGYYANYCRGQCDLSHSRYYHSTLLSKFSSVIGLCCSPKRMAPLDLLYMDVKNDKPTQFLKRTVPDMIVESCDCA